ncbi:MAG: penicillin-binding protein 1C, partial [Mesorhizobium sp.]
MRGSAVFSRKSIRRITIAAAGVGGLALVSIASLWELDRAFPPPLPAELTVSTEVQDRDGQLLRAFATPDGYWRLGTRLDQVDKQFVDM